MAETSGAASQPKLTALFSGLITRREAEVLKLLAEGASNKAIAARLHISHETVNSHLKSIYQKTGSQNRIEALIKTGSLTAFRKATDTNR